MHRQALALSLFLPALALARPQVDSGALSGLPACAQTAANAALGSSGCPLNDKDCICSSTAFINAITGTVTQTCSPSDVQAALTFGRSFCGASLAGGSATGSGATEATASPTAGPTDDDYNVSTTTVPGTVTSMTSVPDGSATITDVTSVTSVPVHVTANATAGGGGGMMTTCTTTMMTTVLHPGPGGPPHNATFTGAAVPVKHVGHGIMAAAVGVAGAVAFL